MRQNYAYLKRSFVRCLNFSQKNSISILEIKKREKKFSKIFN